MLGAPVRRSYEEERDWIDGFLAEPSNRLWLMYRTDEARPIGLAALAGVASPMGRRRSGRSSAMRAIAGRASAGSRRARAAIRVRGAGPAELRLDVYGYNAAGLRLYERLGFREVERHPMKIERDGRRWDVIRMTKIAA